MHKAIVARVNIYPHPDNQVHSLAVGYVLNETIIVGKSTRDESLGLFFNCELQISQEFANANDLIRRKDENGNRAGGMFDENRRVRAQVFRGVRSNGYWCPLSYLSSFGDTSNLKEGDEIESFNGVPICGKYYTPKTLRARTNSSVKQAKNNVYFPEHSDTEQLKHCLRRFNDGDNIVVTLKVHGTSQRVAKNYSELPEKWYDKLLGWFGISRDRKIMSYLNGTRRVTLKGDDNGYYSEHFRVKVAERLNPFLEPHMQVFFEVVGWESDCYQIMPSHSTSKSKDKELTKKYGEKITYSYGCKPGEFDIYVYRIAYVLPDGETIDLTWDQVKKKCGSWGVKHVPELDRFTFNGNVNSLVEHIESLSDGPDPIDSSHIREGVCIRINSSEWQCYKNKGWTFKVLEGIAKESDEYVDQEEVQ
jgi:hypothetical protein